MSDANLSTSGSTQPCGHGAVLEWPSFVLSYEELVARPKNAISELGEFVEACGLSVARDPRVPSSSWRRLSTDEGRRRAGRSWVRIPSPGASAGQLDGIHVGDRAKSDNAGALLEAVSSFYGEDYYGTSYDQSGVPYRRSEKLWVDFFSRLAGSIVATLNPGTALDMGCATGMLVETLAIEGSTPEASTSPPGRSPRFPPPSALTAQWDRSPTSSKATTT